MTLLNSVELSGHPLSVYLTEVSQDETPEQVLRNAYEVDQTNFVRAGLFLVRPFAGKQYTAKDIDRMAAALAKSRAGDAPLHLLYSSQYVHKISKNLNTEVAKHKVLTQDQQQQLISSIRQAELSKFAIENDAIFSFQDGASLFRLPSGTFSQNFLRVGNLLAKQNILNCFFFWLLPHLKETESILVETWSIGALLHNCARLLQLYDPKRSDRLRVEMLSRYHDSAAQGSANTQIAVSRVLANRPRELLVLTSASMTEQSMNRLRSTISFMPQAAPDKLRFLTAYKLTKAAKVTHLCDLSSDSRVGSFESVKPAIGELANRRIVDIDSKTYFPSTRTDNFLRITGQVANLNFRFYSDYGATRAISVHRDNKEGDRPVRHHAYYVDVESLLQSKQFTNKLAKVLGDIKAAPTCIVVPRHSAGLALARKAHQILIERLQKKIPIYVDGNLDAAERTYAEPDTVGDAEVAISLASRIRKATADDRLLVVDDVTIRGVRLSNYQRNLRIRKYQGAIDYLIGVARPSDRNEWAIRRNDLTMSSEPTQNRMLAVELVVLPDWDKEHCPWCHEQSVLLAADPPLNVGQRSTSVAALRPRAAMLASAPLNQGMSKRVLWSNAKPKEVSLTAGSIFIPKKKGTREAAVFAAVASALQEMRTRKERALESRFPFPTIVDPKMYLSGRFNDAILKAAILRASSQDELICVSARGEQDRLDLLKTLSGNRKEGACLNIELALASAVGKLPSIAGESAILREISRNDGGKVANVLAMTRNGGSR